MIRHRTAMCAVAVSLVALLPTTGTPTPTLAAASPAQPAVAASGEAWAWPPLLPVPVRALNSGSAVAVDLEAERVKWEASVVAWQLAETLARVKAQAAAASLSRPHRVVPARGQVSDQSHPDDSGVFDRLAQCEAGGNWSINTGNGYYGGLQFTLASWRAVGGQGMPHRASRDTQIEMGRRLQARQGWGAWPHCSRAIGLR